ncbi:hypothetical protein LAZ67_22002421 [Cordylochernes scorpioides]|uniref:Ig-like domain-containing protein n=1 Tax=Cordylochernes scorpioides TaxID=51811 RepID=A0ABY6LSN1_9ARAC|nr:hypothetical protein LAZ67_22002421 [Cordylochernes scorpioides]
MVWWSRGSEFDTRPRDTAVNPGDTAVLECRVRHRRGECAWLKAGNVVGRIPNKYTFQREPTDGDCSITVQQASLEDDDATWRCQVTQASLTDPTLTSDPVRLTVRGRGSQEFDTRPRDTAVNPGDTAVLECRVRHRRGECAWLKAGNVVGRIPNKYTFQREPTDGDCSITVQQASLEDDDATWRCQVTQASLTDPTLTSDPVRLTVREAPLGPRIESNTNPLQPGEALTARAGELRRLHCVSRRGNPPAALRWLLEELELPANQTNATDVDHPKTFQAVSVLDYVFLKEHNQHVLRCVAMHEAYSTKTSEAAVRLEVHYPPEIALQGRPEQEVEEGSSLSLRCLADANPQANIIWRKSGHSGIYDIKDRIDFKPVRRSDSGVYSCAAKNDLGQSEEVQVEVDVKCVTVPPKIIRIEPKDVTTVTVNHPTKLVCVAEGNPEPKYTWLQQVQGGDPQSWQERGHNATLDLHNVSYTLQGAYRCEARNRINGKEHRAQSGELQLDVTGFEIISSAYHSSAESVK